jgi:hypothetical protein
MERCAPQSAKSWQNPENQVGFEQTAKGGGGGQPGISLQDWETRVDDPPLISPNRAQLISPKMLFSMFRQPLTA